MLQIDYLQYICSLIIMFFDIALALFLNIKSICGSSFTAGSLRLCVWYAAHVWQKKEVKTIQIGRLSAYTL